MPCYLHERDGNVVIADLLSKVIIVNRKNSVVANLGANADWSTCGIRLRGLLRPADSFALTARSLITKATSS